MSASISYPGIGQPASAARLRFGRESAAGEGSVQWLLKRNCSLAPRQLLASYLGLCAVCLLIAIGFWLQGAVLVLPFAGLELLTVGAAMLVYGRHAGDNERIRLQPERLTVERASAGQVERVEFAPSWVRVEPEHGDSALIELTGQGQRILVGRFVRPELRRQLAEELRWALRRWQLGLVPGRARDTV